jgi:hypothetical protein
MSARHQGNADDVLKTCVRGRAHQEPYHRALRAKYPGIVEIIQGFHIFRPASPAHVEG